MLQNRLFSAAIVISSSLVFVALDFFFPQGNWIIPLGFLLVLGSAIECVDILRKSSIGDVTWPALLGCVGVMLAASIPAYWPLFGQPYPVDCLLGELGWPLAATCISLVACFAWYLPSFQPNAKFFSRAIIAGWVAAYFGTSFAFAVAIRSTGEPSWGLFLLVGTILMTKFADAGAYFCGRALGRTKLCPNVSPGKTVEGLLGGILTSFLSGWVYFCVCGPLAFEPNLLKVPLWGVAVFALLLTIAGLFGDLLVSVFKREMGVKDSGRLLPGLGGLWDVTDSLLPAMVAAYLAIVADLLHGPGQ